MISRIINTSNKNKDKARFWKNIFKDEPCFILGNSPSLDDFNISKLSNYLTIGTNRAFLKIDPTILMWQDIELYLKCKENLKRLQAVLFSKDSADPGYIATHYSLIPGPFKLPESPSTLYGITVTGTLAFELAYIMGCNPIVLLGCDCRYRDGKTDFYGTNKDHTAHTLELCNRGLSWIKRLSVDRDIMLPNKMEEIDILLEKTQKKERSYYKGKLLNE